MSVQPISTDVLSKILPIAAAGVAAAIAFANFLPRLYEIAQRKKPAGLGVPGEFETARQKARNAPFWFQISLVLFGIGACQMLLYIALSTVQTTWMPDTLIVIGSTLGPIAVAAGAAALVRAIWQWTSYYIFLVNYGGKTEQK